MLNPTRADIEAARDDPRLANALYHDWQSETYDEKWSISYDERCITYARDRFVAVVGAADQVHWPYRTALEIGCGTGFFLLNLSQAGVIAKDGGLVTDISPGMVQVATRNAGALGIEIDGCVATAEALPYADDSVDLVVGHAVLHHLPDVECALREALRVLKPGGRFVFAGEPTRYGDVVARRLSRLTWQATLAAGRLPGLRGWVRPRPELDASSAAASLEAVVDLHTFMPGALRRMAISAGAVDVRVQTEELTASWFGWPVRTFECAVAEGRLGYRWAMFAYRGWQRLAWIDATLLRRVVPAGLFYNALLTGVKPADAT